MPGLNARPDPFWRGRRVFITGHTGFKGGWLALWLAGMGAKVYGYALKPPTDPSFYAVTGLADYLAGNTIADIRAAESLMRAVSDADPEIVFHLAAQPLVRYSYEEPLETYSVNMMGTVTLFEALRQMNGVKSVVNVTTDKCYENHERDEAYSENQALGGHDPYSSSKACSELVTSAYRRSFFSARGVSVGSARAGNVIGGGDWSVGRVLPDFFRSIDSGQVMSVRYPNAVRPWQHVLEPLSGYLMLAKMLFEEGESFAEAWNFGPDESDSRSVRGLLDALCLRIPAAAWGGELGEKVHEAGILKLNSQKARERLNWRPHWTLETALDKTIDWHLAWRAGDDMVSFSLRQIASFQAAGEVF